MINKNVSFYGKGSGVLGGNPIRRDYDSRLQMADQLMQQGASTAPVQSPLEGLARALTAGVGGYFGGEAEREMQDREAALGQDMATVMAGGAAKPWINPDTGTAEVPMGVPNDVGGLPDINLGIDDGTGGSATNQEVKMVPTAPAGGYEGMMAALSKINNPDMAGFGQQISMAQMQQQQEARQAEIARQNALADAMALKAAPGAQNGPTGRPASPIQISNKYDEVLATQGQQAADTWLRRFGNTATIDAGGNIVFRSDAATPNMAQPAPVVTKSLAPNQTPEHAQTTAAAGAAGTQAVKASGEAFDSLGKINKGIVNINSAIAAIDAGAKTGPIYDMLPSVTAASVELKNIQNRMGLDVISSVTFGALSAPELKMALETALPTKLEGPALRKWLVDKKNAQEKLAAYLNKAAVYLGQPGNTIASWAEMRKGNTGQGGSTLSDEDLLKKYGG